MSLSAFLLCQVRKQEAGSKGLRDSLCETDRVGLLCCVHTASVKVTNQPVMTHYIVAESLLQCSLMGLVVFENMEAYDDFTLHCLGQLSYNT